METLPKPCLRNGQAATKQLSLWALSVVANGCSRFFLGSDSAPHADPRKLCVDGCAGVFSAAGRSSTPPLNCTEDN